MRKIKTAKGLTDRRKRLRIAILVDERFSVSRSFLRGFYEYVRPERDWLILQAKAATDELPAVLDWEPDVIIAPSVKRIIEPLKKGQIPLLAYLSGTELGIATWFRPDDEAIGKAAAEHFLSCGYRHGACVYDERHYGSTLRLTGFVEAMKQAGKEPFVFAEPVGSVLVRDAWKFTAEDPRMQDWLKDLPRSTGIYAWTDSTALWISECCFRMGISVPEHMGIVGTDNHRDICLRAWPGLDSVMLPYSEIGMAAGRWIDAHVAGLNPDPPVPFPIQGVYRRKSTMLQIAEDEELAPVYAALRQASLKAVSVPVLTRASGWSRRTLERRLRERTGTSVNTLIEKRRLEEAEYLLVNTDRTVADIADECGFATARSLELLFRKYHAMTPAAYAKSRRTE